MSRSKIEWTDRVWNPVRGCSRVSEGCRNCYAERQAARFSRPLVQDQTGEYAGGDPFAGFARMTREGPRWTGRVELIPEKLAEPMRWRKPSLVLVNSMSDLFHESLPFEAIAQIFGVMAASPWHTFQVLTKRPERMVQFFGWIEITATAHGDEPEYECLSLAHDAIGAKDLLKLLDSSKVQHLWPLPNVWLGVSVEDQETADARIPLLLATPAAKRFVSYEPALGPVDFTEWFEAYQWDGSCDRDDCNGTGPGIDWLIVGGESGPGARPCDVAWIRSAVEQCRDACPTCFVKQLGANPWANTERMEEPANHWLTRVKSRKGSDPYEWPEDLRVREWPRLALERLGDG